MKHVLHSDFIQTCLLKEIIMIENASFLLNNGLEFRVLIALFAMLAGVPLIGVFHRMAIAWATLVDQSISEHGIRTEVTSFTTSLA